MAGPYKEGDRSIAICPDCHRKVETRMQIRDYVPHGWGVTVPSVLVGVCTVCNNIIAIPHQSCERINQYRERGEALANDPCDLPLD